MKTQNSDLHCSAWSSLIVLKPSKCKIRLREIEFLGHNLQGDSIGPQDKSVGQILKTERPQKKKQCRSLLGMVTFYRRYIPNCAKIVAPIAELTRNHCPNNVQWGEKQENAFEEIKRILSSGPILKLPDLERDFIVPHQTFQLAAVSYRNTTGLNILLCTQVGNCYPESRIIRLGNEKHWP